jgi:hypothetical protein
MLEGFAGVLAGHGEHEHAQGSAEHAAAEQVV